MKKNFEQRLNEVLPEIISDEFISKSNVAGEIPFHVFDYLPEFELKMREHIDFMINRIASYHQNIKLIHIKLFDLMIDHMRERGNLEKAFILEAEKGFR